MIGKDSSSLIVVGNTTYEYSLYEPQNNLPHTNVLKHMLHAVQRQISINVHVRSILY